MKKTTLCLLFLLITSVLFAQDTLLWKGRAKSYVSVAVKGKKRVYSSVCEIQITDSSVQIIPIEKIFDQIPTAVQSEIKFREIKKIRKIIYVPWYTLHLNDKSKIYLTHFSKENKKGFSETLSKKAQKEQAHLKIVKPPLWEYLVVTPLLIAFPPHEIFEPVVE